MEPSPIRQTVDAQILEAFRYLLINGSLPSDLPDALKQDARLAELAADYEELQNFTLAIANGDLDPELKMKGHMAGALKSLQANLRHLTWQAQRIASGDLSQRVRFLGDFSLAFNLMVESLDQSRKALVRRARELSVERQAAVNLMREAQTARKEVENAYLRLHEQMEEINALQAELREQAIRDTLTGCYNRRYMEEILDREFARAKREAYPVSLIMIDIDHFKTTNDRYGHPTGDAMLQSIGYLLQGSTRAGDIVCRCGGDEFLLVLSNTRMEDALHRAETCRLDIQNLKIPYNDIELTVTASVGVAVFPSHGASSDGLLKAVDRALYGAKDAGRNHTCTPEGNCI